MCSMRLFDGKCRLILISINDICSDSYLSRNTCYGCYQGVDHIHYLKIHRLVYLGFYFHKLYTTGTQRIIFSCWLKNIGYIN